MPSRPFERLRFLDRVRLSGSPRWTRRSARQAGLLAAAVAGATGLALLHEPARSVGVDVQQQVGAAPTSDPSAGKENSENVFVRDSAIAQEKFRNAQRMEREHQWNNAASFYQEVLEKYAGRVVPAGVDKDGVIDQYTSIATGVRDRLCHWPPEGLNVYRAMNEPKAAALLEAARKDAAAGKDDSFPLHEALRLYFVTDSGKAAALRLIDEKLEQGEFAGAAWLGDELLNTHPNLIAERPATLFRTALAYHLAGNDALAQQRAATLAANFPNEVGVVRGKDVILAQALQQEMAQSPATARTAGADSWPMLNGNLPRDLVSSAHASIGTRIAEIPLAAPEYKGTPLANKVRLMQLQQAAAENGTTIGVIPVADRGELYFQDGMRVYAVSLENGAPLPGWKQSYPGPTAVGQYVLGGVWGSTRGYQQTITLTDRCVLAVMGQPDLDSIANGVAPQQQSEARLVCLDRETGREQWVVAPSSAPGVPKNDDEKAIRDLHLSGSPLVVGDNVLVIGRSDRGGEGEDCYVLAFDLSNGHFRWGCYIASSGATANVMWGMQQTAPRNDNTSHLAYSNGRVYVLTNLGAVAALDAYSGAISWLDIYPTNRASAGPMMRNRFNPMMNAAMGARSGVPLKPWMYNPVIAHDGKLFVLPIEGDNLLIYDAATGKELRRINLVQLAHWNLREGEDQPDRPNTLVGVSGDLLYLAGATRVICLDWAHYDSATFPGPDAAMVRWISPQIDLAGRSFMTAKYIYAANKNRLYRREALSGLADEQYPAPNAQFEKGEGPGNMLVSGDEVVVAGAESVAIYTDIAVALAKLDRQIADAPADPEPRLRYAEVKFVAGRPEEALGRLDEAIGLMGGEKGLASAPRSLRDQVFTDAMHFAQRGFPGAGSEARARTGRFFDAAAAAAGTPQEQVVWRLARARFEESGGADDDLARAVALYQQVLADPQLRSVAVGPDALGAGLSESASVAPSAPGGGDEEKKDRPLQADEFARGAIAALIAAHGPGVYAPYEQAAAKALESATAGDSAVEARAERLLSISLGYPNSAVAPRAMLAAADAYEQSAQPRGAIRVLRDMWFRYGADASDRARISEGLARNYLALPPRDRADGIAAAIARLAKAPEDATLSRDMPLPNGHALAAGTRFSAAVEAIHALHATEPEPKLPDFNFPSLPTAEQVADGVHRPLAFRGQTQRLEVESTVATVLPGVSALVTCEPDYRRPDRVVAWGDGVTSFFAGGQTTPLATCKALQYSVPGAAPRAPGGVAWAGDTALLWGSGAVAAVDGDHGKIRWEIDLRKLGRLEEVRGEEAPAPAAPPPGRRGPWRAVAINGVVIRQQIAINGVVVNAANAPEQPAAAPEAPADEVEQAAKVIPVGDRVLIATSRGRLLSVELSDGKIDWQLQLGSRAPEHLAATQDFTVAQMNDEMAGTSRLFALDSYSGHVLGSKTFSLQGGNGATAPPVNLALSPEGVLVYTLPDELCRKDLYANWDAPDQVSPSVVGQAPYAGANQPGQLQVRDGRILALSNNAPAMGEVVAGAGMAGAAAQGYKWVSVRSLETGLPITFIYKPPDGPPRAVDRVLSAGTKEWDVSLRVVGPDLYVVSPQHLYGYDLNDPSQTFDTGSSTQDNSQVRFHEAFVGQKRMVVVGASNATQTPGNLSTQYWLYIYRRFTRAGKVGGARDFFPMSLNDAKGIYPNIEPADGGLYYATGDGKVHALLGAEPAHH